MFTWDAHEGLRGKELAHGLTLLILAAQHQNGMLPIKVLGLALMRLTIT